MATVVIPVPNQDSDPSEVAVSWRVLTQLRHRVIFATQNGSQAVCDELMVKGFGLDVWAPSPRLARLALVGRVFQANGDARVAHEQLLTDSEWSHPMRWEDIRLSEVDGLLLPGGHRARGMRDYLESTILQRLIVEAFNRGMPVAAICHGPLLVARSIDPKTGHSVLYGCKTTALTWELERRAWRITRVGRFWDRDYFRTYREQAGQPDGYMSVQAEVTRALQNPDDFIDVQIGTPDAALKRSGRVRDSLLNDRPAFLVRDGHYVSARWPGDVHTFARAFAAQLSEYANG